MGIKPTIMDLAFDLPEDFAADESFVHYCFQSNEADVLFWEKYLNDHPEKRAAAEKGKKLVFMMSIRVEAGEKEDAFRKLGINRSENEFGREAQKTNPQRRLRPYLVTGTLVLIAAGFFWKISVHKNSRAGRHADHIAADYRAARGEKRQIMLNDGTRIVLNALSRLTVDPAFGKNNREVSLSGEAFFQVANNASQPFMIHTDNMDITVLGTTLNVRDYPGDRKAEAALLSGSVAVQLHTDSSQKIILKPDEKIVSYKPGKGIPPLNNNKSLLINPRPAGTGFAIAPLVTDPLLDSGTVATAWMDNKLVFHDESFEDLAEQMSRKYDVQFHFSHDALKEYRFTGVFSKESIAEALHALQLTSPSDPFDFSITGKGIYIHKK